MRAVIQEAARAARAQPAASMVTILIVAGMILTVMMTTGRTVAAEQSVLATIDNAGTRTIEIRADDSAGLTSGVLDRIRRFDGIEWTAAFSSATDATNTLIPDGARVPVRYVYSDGLDRLGVPDVYRSGLTAYASQAALEQLGLADVGGSITLTNDVTAVIGDRMTVPDYLRDFEPVTLIPVDPRTPADVNVVLIIARTPELVAPLSEAVLSVLAVTDPTAVTVQTSEALAQLRGLIQSQLGTSSRSLVLGLLGVTSILVAAILYGLVLMRRKDFGRRRALGASRGYIIGLLITQTALLASIGIAVGFVSAIGIALSSGDALPGFAFMLALGILALAATLLAAVPPAVAASRREPIQELRVP